MLIDIQWKILLDNFYVDVPLMIIEIWLTLVLVIHEQTMLICKFKYHTQVLHGELEI
jgi:hypothetical protein